jgi:hypothetical protein
LRLLSLSKREKQSEKNGGGIFRRQSAQMMQV